MLFEVIALIFFLLGLLGLTILIFVPLSGALVRYRANYVPKPSVQLDVEVGLDPPTPTPGYFRILVNVKRVQGWSGLYKGFWPSVIQSLVMGALLAPFAGSPHRGTYRVPAGGIVGIIVSGVIASLFSIPFIILINRSIVTPYRLSSLSPKKSLKLLFSPRERRNPLKLFTTPGLLLSSIIYSSIIIFGLGSLHRYLLPGPNAIWYFTNGWKGFVPFAVYLVTALSSVVVLTPLEVVIVRLSIQKNHPLSVESENENEDIDGSEQVEDEDVIELRQDDDNQEPYSGLVDCVKKIVNEEGWRTLYRAWWVTLIGVGLTAFAV